MQNSNELDMENFSDSKALAFEVWGLKTSLGQFGPKPFAKDQQAIRWEPQIQFSETGPHVFRNYEMNPTKL